MLLLRLATVLLRGCAVIGGRLAPTPVPTRLVVLAGMEVAGVPLPGGVELDGSIPGRGEAGGCTVGERYPADAAGIGSADGRTGAGGGSWIGGNASSLSASLGKMSWRVLRDRIP